MATLSLGNGRSLNFTAEEAPTILGFVLNHPRFQEHGEPQELPLSPASHAPGSVPVKAVEKRPAPSDSIRKAIRVLEMIVESNGLSMDAINQEFNLTKRQAISGIATCVRNAAIDVGFAGGDAYIDDRSTGVKLWKPTPKSAAILQALRDKLK